MSKVIKTEILQDAIIKIGLNTPFIWDNPFNKGLVGGIITKSEGLEKAYDLHYIFSETPSRTVMHSNNNICIDNVFNTTIIDWYEENPTVYECCENCDYYKNLFK